MSRRRDAAALANNTGMQIVDAVRRAAPNPARPRLRIEFEALVAEVDSVSAAVYSEIEHSTEKLNRLGQELEEELKRLAAG